MSAPRDFSRESESEASDEATLLVRDDERAAPPPDRTLTGDPNLLATFVESVPAAIAMLDQSLRYVQVSNRWLRDFALTREAIIGRPHHEIFPNLPERWREANLRCLSVEKCEEDRLVRADGTERWMRWEVQPWGVAGTDDSGILILSEDITERKQYEQVLRHAHDELAHRVQRGGAELARVNECLRYGEEAFALLVESVTDYAIYLLDVDGHVISWNRGAERIKGYRPEEIIGRHYSVFYPPETQAVNKPALHLEYASNEGRYADEGWRVRKDGSHFWASVVITALYRDGALHGFAKVTRDATERKRAEEAIRELSGRLLRAQDETQRRLARELHDSTGQLLSALALNLVVVKQSAKLEKGSQAGAALAESMQLIERATREIRTLSYLLHPPLLDEAGLYHALRWYIEGFVQRTNIKVDFDAPMDAPRAGRDVEMALFRVVQESLTNIHRHAETDRTDIHFVQEPDCIVLKIRDYGKGMPPEAYERLSGMPATLGVGLRGMFERVRQLDGYIDLAPENPGALLRVVLPLVRGDCQ